MTFEIVNHLLHLPVIWMLWQMLYFQIGRASLEDTCLPLTVLIAYISKWHWLVTRDCCFLRGRRRRWREWWVKSKVPNRKLAFLAIHSFENSVGRSLVSGIQHAIQNSEPFEFWMLVVSKWSTSLLLSEHKLPIIVVSILVYCWSLPPTAVVSVVSWFVCENHRCTCAA